MNALSAHVLTLGENDWQKYWPIAAEMIAPACELSGGRHTLESTKAKLSNGDYVLLVAIVGNSVNSACVCGIKQYPAADWLSIILCGGDNMLQWLDSGRLAIERLARLHNCVGLEVIGRPGWKRAMDLTPSGVVMERRL